MILDTSAFTDAVYTAVAARLQRRNSELVVERGEESLWLILKTAQGDLFMGLDRLYEPYAVGQLDLSSVFDAALARIDAYMAMVDNATDQTDWETMSEHLLPHLGQQPSQEWKTIYRPWWDGLVVSLVLDSPTAMRFVTRGDAEQWQQSDEALYEKAFHNLEQRLRSTELQVQNIGDELVWISVTKDGYDADRILIPSFWTEQAAEWSRSEIYILIRHRDELICATDPQLLAPLAIQETHTGYELSQGIFQIQQNEITGMLVVSQADDSQDDISLTA